MNVEYRTHTHYEIKKKYGHAGGFTIIGHCLECPAHKEFEIPKILANEEILLRFQKTGWEPIGKSQGFKCPVCISTREPKSMESLHMETTLASRSDSIIKKDRIAVTLNSSEAAPNPRLRFVIPKHIMIILGHPTHAEPFIHRNSGEESLGLRFNKKDLGSKLQVPNSVPNAYLVLASRALQGILHLSRIPKIRKLFEVDILSEDSTIIFKSGLQDFQDYLFDDKDESKLTSVDGVPAPTKPTASKDGFSLEEGAARRESINEWLALAEKEGIKPSITVVDNRVSIKIERLI